jgi:hypothetical protein
MKRNGFRALFGAILISSFLAIASLTAVAQTPSHPPAPGEIQNIPMYPITPLPYSWEVGKHRSQRFGELGGVKPSKAVRKLLKEKAKEEKARSKSQ